MACEPNELLAGVACLETTIWGPMADAVEIVLLCAILDGNTMSCDPQDLLEQAKCIFATIPPGAMPAVRISLLCQIAAGGGGGGGGLPFLFGAGSPEGAVSASPGRTYVRTDTGGFWYKSSGSGTMTGWVEGIA